MHSSQNEQDNRFYARLARVPMLEPADSDEARSFTIRAFELSERFELPVILRMTTRICHSKGMASIGEPVELDRDYRFEKDSSRYVMIPAHARKRHALLVREKLPAMRALTEEIELNRVENARPGAPFGVVCSGVAYQYVREMYPDAPVLKLGMTNPLPLERIRAFAKDVRELVVVEELEDYLLQPILAAGIPARGKPDSFRLGELNPERVRAIIEQSADPATQPPDESLPPPRPPAMCPGCGHRGIFYILRKLKVVVTGDIGCYTLATLPPLEALDSCLCMGASIGNGSGLCRVLPREEAKKVVAVIGDSTFFHSGLTGVLDAVYNGGGLTLLILDNSTTAMTGLQEHPGTGKDLRGEPAYQADPAEVCRALGVRHVAAVDSFDIPAAEKAIREAIDCDEASVVVCRHRCVLLDRRNMGPPYQIDAAKCEQCKACLRLGCRAIQVADDGRIFIDAVLCHGCGLCAYVCKFDAIGRIDEESA